MPLRHQLEYEISLPGGVQALTIGALGGIKQKLIIQIYMMFGHCSPLVSEQ